MRFFFIFTINGAGLVVSGVGSNLTKNNGSARGFETIDFDAGAREQRWLRKRGFIFSGGRALCCLINRRAIDKVGGIAKKKKQSQLKNKQTNKRTSLASNVPFPDWVLQKVQGVRL